MITIHIRHVKDHLCIHNQSIKIVFSVTVICVCLQIVLAYISGFRNGMVENVELVNGPSPVPLIHL